MRKSTTRGLRVLHNDATARATSTMAEYLEDQAMEVEALESILMEDMVVVEGSEVRRTHLLRISRKNRTPVYATNHQLERPTTTMTTTTAS